MEIETKLRSRDLVSGFFDYDTLPSRIRISAPIQATQRTADTSMITIARMPARNALCRAELDDCIAKLIFCNHPLSCISFTG